MPASAKKSGEEFPDYVNRMNNAASLDTLAVGLGVPTGKVEEQAKVTDEKVLKLLELAYAGDNKALRSLISGDFSHLARRNEAKLSILDVVTLGLTKDDQILNYLRSHGIDLDNKKDLEYVQKIFSEAFQYFDEKIAESPQEKINPEIKTRKKPRLYRRNERDQRDYEYYNLTKEDILNVFKISAGKGKLDKGGRELIAPACGILRIAAVIDFMERDPVLSRLDQAYEQIKDIKDDYFVQGSDKTWELKSSRQIDRISPKCTHIDPRLKDRWRVIDKLLQKPTNRTEDVLDGVGMRFRTNSPYDTLMFIYNLIFNPETAVFPSSTIHVKDTKNTFFDKGKFEEALRNKDRPEVAQKLIEQLSERTVDAEEIESDNPELKKNRNSSKYYQAVHIILDIPLKTQTGAPYYFPIELQFFDKDSWVKQENQAPHGSYVEGQITDVRRRLKANNLDSAYKKSKAR